MSFDIQSATFFLINEGGISHQKTMTFSSWMDAYKSLGANTVTLVTYVPVDPKSGEIKIKFDKPAWNIQVQTAEYFSHFSDLAKAKNLKVIWKPQFVLDDGTNNNVNEWSNGRNFYPDDHKFPTSVFLKAVNQFWQEWAPVAQRHNVDALVLGTEQGIFASAPYTADWLKIISTARASFAGALTYAENHFEPVNWAPNIQFWSALDWIGIDNYLPLGNGTVSTPYEYAVQKMFNNSMGIPNLQYQNIVTLLYQLSTKYNKPIFFTETGITPIDGAMNEPAAGNLTGKLNVAEQANYFKANLEIWSNYKWVLGQSFWDNNNELSAPPGTIGYNDYVEAVARFHGYYWNETAQVVKDYWTGKAGGTGLEIPGGRNLDGTFKGTKANPDVLIGGIGRDKFVEIGGVYEIDGAANLDTVQYSKNMKSFEIYFKNVETYVTDTSNENSIGKLLNVERLKFKDSALALDINGNAGQAYRLYQAALDRLPDDRGLADWINYMDNGGQLNAMAQMFIDSQEFRVKYGALDNFNFVNQLYLNVLDRNGEATGVNAWVGGFERRSTFAFAGPRWFL